MKKLLNTLYITRENCYVSRDGENIVIFEENKVIGRYPIHILDSIMIFNYSGCSPSVMKLCVERNILMSFFTPQGHFCARIIGKFNGNVLVRRSQYRRADSEDLSLGFVKNIIYAKAYNSKKILQRLLRDHRESVNFLEIENSIKFIEKCMSEIKNSDNKDSIRGIEGSIARAYFEVFDELILKQKQDFYFRERVRRPPTDYVNALLSFFYTMLSHEVQSALEGVGIDSYVGFFHTDRPGRTSMALDMMEELRCFMVDRMVVSLINLQIVTKKDFEIKENGAILLTEKGRNKSLEFWQKKKQEEITHPFLNEKIKIGLLPHIQAMLFNRYIRNDLEEYPPFLIRG